MNRRKRQDSGPDFAGREEYGTLLRPPVWFVVVVLACTVVIAATFF